MSRADNWMPLYVADYLRDTMHLTTEQHGAYLMLIMGAWTRGGVLPADDGQLGAIARLPAPAWRKAKPVVMAFFTAGQGGWTHKRIAAELEKAQRLSEARREAGAKGGRPRTQKESQAKPLGFPESSQTETPAQVASPSPSPPPPEVSEVATATSGAAGATPQQRAMALELAEALRGKPSQPDEPDPDTDAWADAKRLLTTRAQLTERQAGAFFGKLLKDHRLRARDMGQALIHADDAGTPDLQPYLTAAAQNLQRGARDDRPNSGRDKLGDVFGAMRAGLRDGEQPRPPADAQPH